MASIQNDKKYREVEKANLYPYKHKPLETNVETH